MILGLVTTVLGRAAMQCDTRWCRRQVYHLVTQGSVAGNTCANGKCDAVMLSDTRRCRRKVDRLPTPCKVSVTITNELADNTVGDVVTDGLTYTCGMRCCMADSTQVDGECCKGLYAKVHICYVAGNAAQMASGMLGVAVTRHLGQTITDELTYTAFVLL